MSCIVNFLESATGLRWEEASFGGGCYGLVSQRVGEYFYSITTRSQKVPTSLSQHVWVEKLSTEGYWFESTDTWAVDAADIRQAVTILSLSK